MEQNQFIQHPKSYKVLFLSLYFPFFPFLVITLDRLEGIWFHTSENAAVGEKFTCEKINGNTLDCTSTKKKNDTAELRTYKDSNSVSLSFSIKKLWKIHGTLSVNQNQLQILWKDGSLWTKRSSSAMVVTLYLGKSFKTIVSTFKY